MKPTLPVEQATRAPAADRAVPPASARASEYLQTLLNDNVPDLMKASISLETQRVTARQVDGRIIGTGQADFTTQNTCYTLKYSQDKTFQLFDVPGIEGDEVKYAALVKAAVATAHLVVYVNGTNKKPEKATAEKIRSYLNRGTQVCPVINVRGNADAYEFDSDRVCLAAHGNHGKALEQTVQVLRGVLSDDVLLPGYCVQGLLGFSSLAMDGKESTIHPSRSDDLAIQQHNYLKHFGSTKTMYEFSQLQQIAGVMKSKLGTFKQDIVESNKTKVRELLVESVAMLTKIRDEHHTFLHSVQPEFRKCRDAVDSAMATFDRMLEARHKNLWNAFFNHLSERAEDIVREHFGDNDRITSEINQAFRKHQKETETNLSAQLDESIGKLQESLDQAIKRLVEDVRRVDFQQRLSTAGNDSPLHYQPMDLDMDLSLKEWGSIAFNVGSYAVTGAGIGSVFPGIGTAIGAAVGAVVGALVSLVGFFTGKDKRIRKAQQQVQEKIDEVRDRVIDGLPPQLKKLSKSVRDEVNGSVLGWVDAMHVSLCRPVEVIDGQMALMNQTRQQLEKMPYGTIRAI